MRLEVHDTKYKADETNFYGEYHNLFEERHEYYISERRLVIAEYEEEKEGL